ncbi:hypothetical protein [Phenylobacterium soli]|uniref:Pentapeptide MXKDX repeat protein n=1 Tax=Phenylobacterium soli TaxID=2170551 RepID=A0A328AI10_9CAUL|nr:hypothetical protein [Phenylobacterium soli]RAK54145.1 hypothetical protein DJ017_06240 [Phenylobacterium soli]
MRPTVFVALAAAAALVAGPGFAQPDHDAHHPATDAKPAAAAPAPGGGMAGMSQADMHKMCMGMMGKDMAPKAVHEHSGEKSGMAMGPNGKPLSKDEMAAMHEKCAAMMSDEHAAAPPK